ncbi:MAG TPA: hypothetical protein VGD31_01130 [Sphingobacteriaceae bacterium]
MKAPLIRLSGKFIAASIRLSFVVAVLFLSTDRSTVAQRSRISSPKLGAQVPANIAMTLSEGQSGKVEKVVVLGHEGSVCTSLDFAMTCVSRQSVSEYTQMHNSN